MRLRRRDVRPDRPRIFGIGLNKTGTTSLDAALRILGFRSLHYGGPRAHEAVQRAIDEGAPLLTHLHQRFDAFSDIGLLARRFRLLDAQYPASWFILTTRPVDDWIASRRRHVESNRHRHAVAKYAGTFLEVDEAAWRQEWSRHLDTTRAYFEGRHDFLEVDLTADPTWAPICALLGVPQPARSFPERNRSDARRKTGRRWFRARFP